MKKSLKNHFFAFFEGFVKGKMDFENFDEK